MKIEVSLLENSVNKEVKELYAAGFTKEQVMAIAKFVTLAIRTSNYINEVDNEINRR